MTDMMRRMVAEQLAAALADAMPAGAFDRGDFVRRMLADAALPELVLTDLLVELDLPDVIPDSRAASEAAP
ncbi:MAG TPA: hypothetical protein VEZ46_04445 [Mycobacteriales bacterium]|nr:hypothetical protein [Mycobacteriales bacterium]